MALGCSAQESCVSSTSAGVLSQEDVCGLNVSHRLFLGQEAWHSLVMKHGSCTSVAAIWFYDHYNYDF
jgi:hypothetical protein